MNDAARSQCSGPKSAAKREQPEALSPQVREMGDELHALCDVVESGVSLERAATVRTVRVPAVKIVLVHGIDNEQLTPDGVEAEWLLALAGGVRLAGRPDLADRLWPPRSRPDAIDCRSAYYGDLFRTPDQMGGAADLRELTPEQATFAEGLAVEWLDRIAGRAPESSPDAAQARFALELYRDSGGVEPQGMGNLQRQVLKTLARHPWMARPGMAFAQRFVVAALVQVTRYLSDELIRALAQQRVLDLIEEDTRILIGHSLGSVVAYEAAHRLAQPLPLLLTLGSPLGLRTIVTDRLRPPPSFPPRVGRWMNVADRDVVVAAEPDLRPLFAGDPAASSRFEGVLVDNGSAPHSPVHYLGKTAVGRAISEALD
jgi:hypothetical protein